MDFGEVLERSWRIIWKYKVLWIFGILAGSGTAGGNGASANSGYRFSSPSQGGNTQFGPWQQYLNQLSAILERIPVWVWILLALLLFVAFIVLIIVNTIGRIGLYKGAQLADEGVPSLSLVPLVRDSLPYFWRVFLLNFLVGLALLALFIILLIPIIVAGVLTLGIGLLCCACLFVPVTWFINVVLEQSNIAIVVEDRGILAGLERGWQVVTQNLGAVIVMALILFIGGGVIMFLLGLPVVFLLVPPLIGAITGVQRAILGGVLVSVLLFLLYLPVLLVLGGIVRSYISTAWTLTFRRLTGRLTGMTAAPTSSPAAPLYQ